jgi:hypothetical protein
MQEKDESASPSNGREQKPLRIRLPGFVSDQEIGLGNALKRTTRYLGIKPCSGCERRAEALNRWITITGRQSR